jgi:hypothetical protein
MNPARFLNYIVNSRIRRTSARNITEINDVMNGQTNRMNTRAADNVIIHDISTERQDSDSQPTSITFVLLHLDDTTSAADDRPTDDFRRENV